MNNFPILKPGDKVEIIAPASRCLDVDLHKLTQLLASWQLDCKVADDIFGHDLLCANTDEMRFLHLKKALYDPDTKAIICARGGYGSMRLIPELAKLTPANLPKWFIGMSDIVPLLLFLRQKWQWPVLHGAPIPDRFSAESIALMKDFLFAKVQQIELVGLPLNALAKKSATLEATITGGNLCLVQTSIGTVWQMDGHNKIILLEEIGERAYRVDRSLVHLQQAGIFKGASAILLGDFLKGEEPNGSSLIKPVLARFAQSCEIPVVQISNIGHGTVNLPIPLGTKAKLNLGKEVKLACMR